MMEINIIAIKEAFDWFLIRACLSVLATLFISVVIFQLYRFSSRLRVTAKRFGWSTIILLLVCSAWATYTAFPTQAEKQGRGNSASVLTVPRSPFTVPSLTPEDFARGFVLTRIGTNEIHDFSVPSNAVVCSDWLAFGAAEDWIYLRGIGNWEEGTVLRIHSDGWVGVLTPTSSVFAAKEYYPLKTKIGIVPKANWGRIVFNAGAQSCFWRFLTPSNSLQLTWQNALY
ncbi:MAG: hypothetical protein J6V88_00715, partial [Kiritimatiellae bacterium]|nr:hypothetical protein [Kiritimatiellia bacterium]